MKPIPRAIRIQGITYKVKRVKNLESWLTKNGYPPESKSGDDGRTAFVDINKAIILLDRDLAREKMQSDFRHEIAHIAAYCMGICLSEMQCDILGAVIGEVLG